MSTPEHVRLSAQVRELSAACRDREVTLGEVSDLLQGRGMCLFLVLLALPFSLPVPMPGLSTPFGAAIALLGVRLLFRQSEHLPARLAAQRVPAKVFPALLRSVAGVLRVLESLMARRLSFLIDHGVGRRVCGGMIFVCGLLLCLPLPVPFSNFFPAFTVVLLACAMVERDGVTALTGVLFFALTLAFFGLLAWGGTAAIDWAFQWLKELFKPTDTIDLPLDFENLS